jgi:hypothetical protein
MESTLQDTEMQQQSSPSGHRNEEPSPDLAGILNILSDILRKQEEDATRQAIQQMELDSLKAANESTEDIYRDSTSTIFGPTIFGSPTHNPSQRLQSSPLPLRPQSGNNNQGLQSGNNNQGLQSGNNNQGLQSGNNNQGLQSGNNNQGLQSENNNQGFQSGNYNAQPRVQFASQYRGSPENFQYNNPSNQHNVQRRSSFAQRAANNLPSLWEGRRSNFAPNPAPNSHFTQSIIPSNASTATNKL